MSVEEISEADAELAAEVETVLEDAPVDAMGRRALATISEGGVELIADAVTPFEDRRAVIEWMTRCTVHSLGELPETWFTASDSSEVETAVLFDRVMMSALLGRPWGDVGAVDDDWAREERLALVAKDVLPAMHAGVREIRWSATDYSAPASKMDPDPLNQRHPAMRPGLTDLLERAEWLVEQLLDGFGSGAEYLSWASFATTATYGELDREVARGAYFETGIRSALIRNGGDGDRFTRENWAARYLLPAITRAAAQEASRGAEKDEAAEKDTSIPQT
ncbi:hypothetical protein [Halobaculum marinum]|uniref:Uncharacterized protein n=1 Tax=Halobaculum marinum TaxID=3031996 RepID=A0ABD5WR36_9EURY|nr:hypothetical protein [Halobaculum sp. DT55]